MSTTKDTGCVGVHRGWRIIVERVTTTSKNLIPAVMPKMLHQHPLPMFQSPGMGERGRVRKRIIFHGWLKSLKEGQGEDQGI
jgi:hypothetical protein